jgi:putative alpha-1,2-mannosidase
MLYCCSPLGMYPLNPANGEYIFGYPLVKHAALQLPENKKPDTIVTPRKGDVAPRNSMVRLNSKEIPVRSVTHRQLLQSGRLEFVLE